MDSGSKLPDQQFPNWELSISLARTTVPPPVDGRRFARVVGGPNDLLVWLESQLGLHAPADAPLRLAALHDAATNAVAAPGSPLTIAASFKDHPYAVGRRLLEHRDAFLMAVPLTAGGAEGNERHDQSIPPIDTCGLSVARAAGLPELIQQYAAVMAAANAAQLSDISTGEPDRLFRIFAALIDGQLLPACRITIHDDPKDWPARWRSLLDAVRAEQKHCTITWSPHLAATQAPDGAALRTVQEAIDPCYSTTALPAIEEDDTLRAVRCASVATASQAVALAIQSLAPAERAAAVIVCEEDATAALIDGHLHAFDLPTMGVATTSQASDIQALLPLAIEAVATPADPRRIKELLSLPDSPIPWGARWLLRKAIDDLPAVGSPRWKEALDAIAADDSDGPKNAAIVNEWIPVPPAGAVVNGGLDADRVARAVALLAEYANGRAHGIRDGIKEALATGTSSAAENAGIEIESVRRSHFQSLHAACRALQRLLATRPAGAISRTEYMQLLDTVSQSLPAVTLHPESAGGPRRARSFAEIDSAAGRLRHVIWVGTASAPAARTRWIHADVERMKAGCGIDLDAPAHQLAARRRAERSGLRSIAGSLFIVAHPSQDADGRPHPFWVTISEMLCAGKKSDAHAAYEPTLLDPAGPAVSIAPWAIARASIQVSPLPQPIDRIQLPHDFAVPPRETVSYSEATKRLTCPAAWTFEHGCGIRANLGAGLKNSSALTGSVAEQIMREVFEQGAPANQAAALQKLDTVLASRLPLIHAGLCQPTALTERLAFEQTMRKAVPVMQCLVDGGIKVSFGAAVGEFRDASGNPLVWNGAAPTGAIDVLGSITVSDRNLPLVIDEKLGNASLYKTLLEEARCWQLVLYADLAGGIGQGTPADAIGYLVLSEGKLYVPAWAAGALANPVFAPYVEVINGPPGATLASQAAALQARVGAAMQAMHQPGAVLDAYPRTAAHGGSLHPDLAFVHGGNDKDAVDQACKYCDYGVLCGKDRVR